jgi:hypothetical protein
MQRSLRLACGSRVVLVAFLMVFAVMPGSVFARHYSRGRGYGGGGGGTVYGSYAAGLGSLIRAEGAYNQMTAQALVTLEQAKSAALDTKLKAAQTYYQLRRINEQGHAEEERKHLAMYKHVDPTPIPRLSASQLDPVTGQITWPSVLTDTRFNDERQPLESLFALRATDPSAVTNTQVEKETEALRDKLDGSIDTWSTSDFFAARHFLESLENESRFTGLEKHETALK